MFLTSYLLKPGQFTLVQVLRGFAAIWVVLFHAAEGRHIDQMLASMPYWLTAFFRLGDCGVAIFFALSGFVIAHSVGKAAIDGRYVGYFALRRSIRLDPPYWVSIALVLMFGYLSSLLKSESFSLPSVGQLLAHATYTQTVLGYPQIDTVYWTLCYEVQFYLVLVFCLLVAHKFTPLEQVVYTGMFVVALLWGTQLLQSPLPGLFLDLWHCFFLGVLAYWGTSSRWALGGMLLLAIAVLAVTPTAFTSTNVLTAVGLWWALKTGFIQHGFSWKPLLFLGLVSYSLYLTHNSITGASFFVLKKIGFSEWASLPITMAACLFVAFAMWVLIERPAIEFSRRIVSCGRAVPRSSRAVLEQETS